MQNPWLSLPKTLPFVLECDKQIILDFNSKVKRQYQLHLEILPEPYTGNPRAKIILLNLNPGFYESNARFLTGDIYFQETSGANLAHESLEYPFYLLDPENSECPGDDWYKRKFRRLIEQFGRKRVAEEICVIEYFPYTSEKFGCNICIPSQAYNFYLVQEAMRRNALIIQMRSKRLWQEAIPALASYHNYYVLRNPQNTAITENNCPDGYPEILKILSRKV
ncbi:MAG: hypothetical protein M3Z24_14190 [Chloroflexota bacterium]|nr:hypothetical protein [Chloroflexota bacterium]